jgi:hypothetical protein
MSLFEPEPPQQPSIPDRVSTLIKDTVRQTYSQLIHDQGEGIQTLWFNQYGLTPQQVCDSLGTEAGKVFKAHGLLTQLIIDLATLDGVQPAIAIPPCAFTINSDGTVVILDTPYIP